MNARYWMGGAFLFLWTVYYSQGQSLYPIRSIPESLHQSAAAVIREHTLDLTLKSPSELESRYRMIVSVLDKKGNGWAKLVLPYDRFNTVGDLSAVIYDASGKAVKKFGKKDFQDVSYLDDVTMAVDSRYLFLDLSGYSLPFTMETAFVIRSKSALFCPDFTPQPEFNTAVEHSRCVVTVPAGAVLQYRIEHAGAPEVTADATTTTYSWEFQNLSAIPDEPDNLPIQQLTPVVYLNPLDFDLAGYTGSFRSWDEFAAWNTRMLESLPPLDASVVHEIQQMTDGLPELEKIQAVYRYLQNSTRYISIQLGVGGWKPFDPNFVHSKKYGDCKALSWYTCALLKAAGVKAYYTLISAGDQPRTFYPDFPDMAFNHVIVTVPVPGDTLFLECTSQLCPLGYIGSFTGNRSALLVDGQSGKVVHVPVPPASGNSRVDSVSMEILSGSGLVRLDWKALFRGTAIEDAGFYGSVLHRDPQAQKDWAEQYFAVKGGKLDHYELRLDPTLGKSHNGLAEAQLTSEHLLNFSSVRLYFQPNFFQPWTRVLTTDTARVSPVFRRFGHTYTADLQVALPAGWTVESLPKAVTETTAFGLYERTVAFADGILHYRRTIVLEEGTFPPEQFSYLVEFFKKMKKWDGERAVFVRAP